MTEIMETNTTAVRKVLGLTYNRLGFENAAYISERITEILKDESKKKISDFDTSEGAEEIRKLLRRSYGTQYRSYEATENLFLAIGRFEELGWPKAEEEGDRNDLLKRLKRERRKNT